VVAIYDGGSVTRSEARRFIRSLDRRGIRTEAAVDADASLSALLGDLATLEILASEADAAADPPSVLYLDARASQLVRYYIDLVGKRVHTVSDDEARDFYEAHLADRFTLPEAVTFRHLFLRSDRHSEPEIEELLRTIRAQLTAGADFPEVVATYSESESVRRGGVVGPVSRGRLDQEFENAVYDLPVGKPSVVRTATGVHVVAVVEVRPAEVTPFDDVKQQIIHAIMDGRNQVEHEEFVATIRAHHPVVDHSLDPTVEPDDIALQIDDRSLTKRQLDAYLAGRAATRGPVVGGDQNMARQLVDQLVEANLLYLDAVDRGLDREQEFTDRWELLDMRRRAQRAEAQRLDVWAKSVGDEEILTFFRDNPARFSLPQRFDASYLVMPLGADVPFVLQLELEELVAFAADPASNPVEIDRRCARVGATFVDMDWATPVAAGHIGPEFQRRLLAIDGPGVTPVFRDEGWLFAIVVRAVEDRRPLTAPADMDLIRDRYVELRRGGMVSEMQARLLEERHFRVVSTEVFGGDDATS
jgi:parvulin-like peptidyl-prolyl isomerase